MADASTALSHDVADIEGQILDSVGSFLSAPRRRPSLRGQRRWPGQPGRDECERSDWVEIAAMGWLGVLAGEADGGLGLSEAEGLRLAALMAEQIGRHVAPEPFTAVAGVSVAALAVCDRKRSADLLSRVVSGDCVAALAIEEVADGAEPSLVAEMAAGGEAGWTVSGRCTHVWPGQPVDGWIVPARVGGDRALLWIAAAAPGASCDLRVTGDGRSLATVRFERVAVAAPHLLLVGKDVAVALARAAAVGRLLISAELLGAGRAALGATIDYLKTRKQFDKPIAAFQAVQHRCVDAFIQLEIAEAALHEALCEAASGGLHGDDARFYSSRAKARCGQAALNAVRAAVQLHGAIGITDECDIGLYFKRVMTLLPRLGGISASRRACAARLLRDRAESAQAPQSAAGADGIAGGDADWDAVPEAQFRAGVRAFLRDNYPAHLRYMPRRVHWWEIADWWRVVYDKGWIAPSWPKEHGGMGLPPAKLIAFIEEFENHGVARAPDQGIVMVGPVLMRYGTAEQCQRFLPKIRSGENIWCQGYSEPGAGSDLASLRTEAVEAGEAFIVNGQKIWTTLAQDATHIFLLVRTDKTVRKQAGISFLLCDLKSPGVTIRPIRDMAGHEEFCEVFFDNVRVPRENLVGSLNQGWEIAKALLGFERIFLGSPKQSQYALGQLRKLAQASGLFGDQEFCARYTALQLDVLDLGAAYRRFVDIVKQGKPLPPSVSLLKIWATETYQAIAVLMAESAGPDGALLEPAPINGAGMDLLAPLFNSSAACIYGGSNEIQRNILAKAVLGLPD
ncbi:MAG: acyl-CoA dehydrogenase [Xanthobacteraceae bacterium]|nr:acyl-CoA dehydrogenase [Xanthobacteraceae bacterium]